MEKPSTKETDEIPTFFRYADGSGNVYRISGPDPYTFRYVPIKPHESSSGTYDGGKEVNKEITQSDFDQVAQLFSEAFGKYADLEMKREMGSGMLSSNVDGESQRLILPMRNEDKQGIEKLLKSFR